MPGMDLKSVIIHRLAALNINQTTAARKVGEKSAAFIQNILLGRTASPRTDTLLKISEALDLDMSYLTDPDSYAADFGVSDDTADGLVIGYAQHQQEPRGELRSAEEQTLLRRQQRTLQPSVAARLANREALAAEAGFTAPKSLPVFSSAQGGDDGEMIIGNDPVDWIARPDPLQNVQQAFAVYVTGDSMEPRYEAGEVLFIHPSKPPLPGDDIILQSHEHHGQRRALIKRLVRQDGQQWFVRQFNPDRTFALNKSNWPTVHLVTGKLNRR